MLDRDTEEAPVLSLKDTYFHLKLYTVVIGFPDGQD